MTAEEVLDALAHDPNGRPLAYFLKLRSTSIVVSPVEMAMLLENANTLGPIERVGTDSVSFMGINVIVSPNLR